MYSIIFMHEYMCKYNYKEIFSKMLTVEILYGEIISDGPFLFVSGIYIFQGGWHMTCVNKLKKLKSGTKQ